MFNCLEEQLYYQIMTIEFIPRRAGDKELFRDSKRYNKVLLFMQVNYNYLSELELAARLKPSFRVVCKRML